VYELKDVSKTFRQGSATVRAVDGVDLRVEDGEFIAVQGTSGSGKTTLLQLLGGLDRSTSGSVKFDGRDLGRMGDRQLTKLRAGAFGFVFQTFNLIPTLSARENVEAALAPLGLGSRKRRARAEAALEEVSLLDRAGHLPTKLSGGEQQRVGIARALAKESRVILADEPTGNLDTATRDEVIALLERVWARHGQTVIVVTHDQAVAARAHRQAWMHDGRLGVSLAPTSGPEGLGEPRLGIPSG
jgi:putative ABC transport system ATP-binding protein